MFNTESTVFERDIYCCITACNETEEEVALSLNIFRSSSMLDLALKKRIHIFIFLDRQRDNEPDTVTFKAYQKLLNIEVRDEVNRSSQIKKHGCRVFNGFIEDTGQTHEMREMENGRMRVFKHP